MFAHASAVAELKANDYSLQLLTTITICLTGFLLPTSVATDFFQHKIASTPLHTNPFQRQQARALALSVDKLKCFIESICSMQIVRMNESCANYIYAGVCVLLHMYVCVCVILSHCMYMEKLLFFNLLY